MISDESPLPNQSFKPMRNTVLLNLPIALNAPRRAATSCFGEHIHSRGIGQPARRQQSRHQYRLRYPARRHPSSSDCRFRPAIILSHSNGVSRKDAKNGQEADHPKGLLTNLLGGRGRQFDQASSIDWATLRRRKQEA